jgi:hypothetical protein
VEKSWDEILNGYLELTSSDETATLKAVNYPFVSAYFGY